MIRIMLSISSLLGFRLGCLDFKGAYFQSSPITLTIYVRPPREVSKHGIIWKLLKLPYVITEAGLQWAKEVEDWLVNKKELVRVPGVSQLYIMTENGRPSMFVAKVTDDILMVGSAEKMTTFVEEFKQIFEISKEIIDS